MERRIILRNGDTLVCSEKSAVIRFAAPRNVLATSANGGGLRRDLTAVFNYSDCGRAGVCQPMEGHDLREHQVAVAKRLGLDPCHTAGLDTAANLDNLAVVTREWEELWVTAIVSGGADVNALCAGDPAHLTERLGEPCLVPAGTINILLVIGARLSPGALTEALLTATEAKTALLRDLMQGSSVSAELATGTGTDGAILICEGSDGECLYNAGKHFKLGELIASAVKAAAAEALFRQTGLCPQGQHRTLRRLKRFGITERSLLEQCLSEFPSGESAIRRAIEHIDQDGFLVSAAALYVHLLDQERSGMLTRGETGDWYARLLTLAAEHYQYPVGAAQMDDPVEALETFLAEVLKGHLREQRRLYPTEEPL